MMLCFNYLYHQIFSLILVWYFNFLKCRFNYLDSMHTCFFVNTIIDTDACS